MGKKRGKLSWLWVKQMGFCALCHTPMTICALDVKPGEHDATLDHIFPVSRGGGNHIGNLQAVHSACNQLKADAHHGTYEGVPIQ